MLLVAALGAVGIAFREVVLVVPAAFLFVRNPVRGLAARGWFLGVARGASPRLARCCGRSRPGLAALLAIRTMVARQTNDYSFAATAAHFLYDKPWLVYLAKRVPGVRSRWCGSRSSTGGGPAPFWQTGNIWRRTSPRSRCWVSLAARTPSACSIGRCPWFTCSSAARFGRAAGGPAAAMVAPGGLHRRPTGRQPGGLLAHPGSSQPLPGEAACFHAVRSKNPVHGTVFVFPVPAGATSLLDGVPGGRCPAGAVAGLEAVGPSRRPRKKPWSA